MFYSPVLPVQWDRKSLPKASSGLVECSEPGYLYLDNVKRIYLNGRAVEACRVMDVIDKLNFSFMNDITSKAGLVINGVLSFKCNSLRILDCGMMAWKSMPGSAGIIGPGFSTRLYDVTTLSMTDISYQREKGSAWVYSRILKDGSISEVSSGRDVEYHMPGRVSVKEGGLWQLYVDGEYAGSSIDRIVFIDECLWGSVNEKGRFEKSPACRMDYGTMEAAEHDGRMAIDMGIPGFFAWYDGMSKVNVSNTDGEVVFHGDDVFNKGSVIIGVRDGVEVEVARV